MSQKQFGFNVKCLNCGWSKDFLTYQGARNATTQHRNKHRGVGEQSVEIELSKKDGRKIGDKELFNDGVQFG